MLLKTLHITTTPHLQKGISTSEIMWNVSLSLLPVVIFSIYLFGLNPLFVLLSTISGAVAADYFLSKSYTVAWPLRDGSSFLSGLLLGLTLPPAFPLWMAFFGGVLSIALGRYVFGGLGKNPFNPALVSRAFLQAAFPVAITSWSDPLESNRYTCISDSVLTFPFTKPSFDAVSGATPLSAFKFDHIGNSTFDLAFGMTSGSLGETSSFLILIGGAYLILRGMMNWRIPFSILITVGLSSLVLHHINPDTYPSSFFMLFSGGLMLGAVYMASDMVGSPMNAWGIFVYGVFIGLLIIVIRLWGGLPEGVMYAILLGNAITPHLDNFFRPRAYGKS